MPKPTTAKLFWNGRSQAVRLPKEYRFAGTAVTIRRDGERVILEQLDRDGWPEGFWDRLGSFASEVRRPRQGRLPKLPAL
jgi:antitoxin VapB